MSFTVGDQVLYPMHGAGTITGVEKKTVLGETHEYYVLHMLLGDLAVMVPVDAAEKGRLRRVMNRAEAEELLAGIGSFTVPEDPNWSKRYRDNMELLRSGKAREAAAVVRTLWLRDRARCLAAGERNMLVSARHMLVSELMLALELSEQEAEDKLLQSILH